MPFGMFGGDLLFLELFVVVVGPLVLRLNLLLRPLVLVQILVSRGLESIAALQISSDSHCLPASAIFTDLAVLRLLLE